MSVRTRLDGHRFRRVWAAVEEIANHPGQSRADLAQRFMVSERQAQADLTIIRAEMGLPLIRRGGYRFTDEGAATGAGAPDLREAQLLVLLLREATRGRGLPQERLAKLIEKVPQMFPPHLQPLVERTMEALTSPKPATQGRVFAALSEALLRGFLVKLHFPMGDPAAPYGNPEPLVVPELLLPHLRSWYLVGEVRHGRTDGEKWSTRMVCLDSVIAVTIQAAPGTNGGR